MGRRLRSVESCGRTTCSKSATTVSPSTTRTFTSCGTRSPVLPEPIRKACLSDQAIIRYLNREDVQRAIHVDADRFAAPDNSWALCSALKENYLQYDYNYNSNHEHFKTLLENKIAVALYNGDANFTCHYSGAKMFV